MRYFMPALFVALLGCSDPATSKNGDPDNAAMQDTGADLSSATDDASESDASDNPGDMAADTRPPDDTDNTDASMADARLDMNGSATDMASRDGSAPDEGLTDAAGSDATEFVCPPPKYNGEVCTQVIVYVRDQDSGTCCEYPTACHIPEGNWGDETYNSLAECSPT